jgi:hypothetical protein
VECLFVENRTQGGTGGSILFGEAGPAGDAYGGAIMNNDNRIVENSILSELSDCGRRRELWNKSDFRVVHFCGREDVAFEQPIARAVGADEQPGGPDKWKVHFDQQQTERKSYLQVDLTVGRGDAVSNSGAREQRLNAFRKKFSAHIRYMDAQGIQPFWFENSLRG